MRVYNLNIENCKATVLHFGSGLIGKAIWNYMVKLNPELENNYTVLEYYWGNEQNQFAENWDKIFDKIKALETDELHIVWAAGKAGFGAKEEEAQAELTHFTNAVKKIEKFSIEYKKKSFFYLMSSAGGIHEGLKLVNSPDKVSLKRPYGELKYAQENILRQSKILKSVVTFRISSVYSHSNVSGRMGLISVLIKNGINNSVSNIFGAERTLRDYVLDDDIAKCVCLNLMKNRRTGFYIEYLIDGKPSSLNEIKLMVEKAVGKKLYLQYSLLQSNATDITFTSEMQSKLFKPSSLYTNMKLLYQNLLKGNS